MDLNFGTSYTKISIIGHAWLFICEGMKSSTWMKCQKRWLSDDYRKKRRTDFDGYITHWGKKSILKFLNFENQFATGRRQGMWYPAKGWWWLLITVWFHYPNTGIVTRFLLFSILFPGEPTGMWLVDVWPFAKKKKWKSPVKNIGHRNIVRQEKSHLPRLSLDAETDHNYRHLLFRMQLFAIEKPQK